MANHVRKAAAEDLPRIIEIYSFARHFMRKTGNPNQWGTYHPSCEQIGSDIEEEKLFVIVDDLGIHGVFFFWVGEDATYPRIYEGAWHSTLPYGTIHRIAGDGSGGIFHTAVCFARQQADYLRIDTHEENTVMQKVLQKEGFRRCGIIYLENGSPRIAYDRI